MFTYLLLDGTTSLRAPSLYLQQTTNYRHTAGLIGVASPGLIKEEYKRHNMEKSIAETYNT